MSERLRSVEWRNGRWLIPVLMVWAFHQAARIHFRWLQGGRLSYLCSLLNPFSSTSRLWAELLVVSGIAYLFHRSQRPGWWPSIVTGLGFFTLYVASFLHFRLLGQPATLERLRDLPELVMIMPPAMVVLGALALLVLLALMLFSLRWRKTPTMLATILVGFGLSLALLLVPVPACAFIDTIVPPDVVNPQLDFYRIGSILSSYRGALRRRAIVEKLSTAGTAAPLWPFPDPDAALRGIASKRNIHIILLESHTDPSWYRSVSLPPTFVDPEYRRWRAEAPSDGVSPVYGGSTANVEFEVLCGLPAYDVLGPVPFNEMRGSPIPCLPQLLSRVGYRTVASVPSASSFFNSRLAYRSVGFSETHFADDFRMDDLDGYVLSVESTLSQSLVFVQRHVETRSPIINYVVTLAGHTPFALNSAKRPSLSLPGVPAELSQVLNVSRYVTRELVAFIKRLGEIDPDSIVLAFGDHAPPVPPEKLREVDYRGTRQLTPELELYTVPILLFDAGRAISLGTVPMYTIPEILVDLLTRGEYCRKNECLHTRALQARPPHVFARESPGRYACGNGAPGARACDQVIALSENLMSSFYALLRLSQ
jgi:hypothetical protein